MAEREGRAGSDDWPWLPPPVGPEGTGFGSPEPLSDVLARRLLAERTVLLTGPLDGLTVTRVSAELMTLDAEGDDPVTLRVDCGEAALAPALTLMDVVELMGVPVRALCLGQVGGGGHRRGRSVQPPGRTAEHAVLVVRADDTARGARAECDPVGRAARGRAPEFLRTGRCRGRKAERQRRGGPRAGTLSQCGRGRGVRHPRRGVPPRRGHPASPGRRAGATTDGVPPVALRVGSVCASRRGPGVAWWGGAGRPGRTPARGTSSCPAGLPGDSTDPSCLRCGHGRRFCRSTI